MTDAFDGDVRAAVLALVEQAPPPPPFDTLSSSAPAAGSPSRRRPVLKRVAPGVAAVCAVTAVLFTVVFGASRPHTATVRVGEGPTTVPSVTTAPVGPPPLCGAQPPGELWAPAGYGGPEAGPATEADETPSPGQLVLRWPGSSGSIELRWPPDPNTPNPGVGASPGDDTGPPRSTSGSVSPLRQTARGFTVEYEVLQVAGALPAEACRQLQISIFDTDPVRIQSTSDWLQGSPFRPTEPLITSSEVADVAPSVGGCHAPAGVTSPPNSQGDGDGSTFTTPEAALEHFVETHRTVILRGYVEFRLPDGSIAYGVQSGGQWVTVVHVSGGAGTWTVTDYDLSGC